MAGQLRVFVSHSHEDDAFCRTVVTALRDAGADVWYDEHNLGSGRLQDVILRELSTRPIFVVILSKGSIASRWVKKETDWAEELKDRDPSRVILPVTAGQIERNDFGAENGWLAYYSYKRIEGPSYAPFPADEAATRLVRALGLAPRGEAPTPVAPQPTEDVNDLLTRGRSLSARDKYAEALTLFERATQLAPSSFDAWANVGYMLNKLKRYAEALPAHEHATSLNNRNSTAWNRKGVALRNLGRVQEALVAYDHALALNPKNASAWNNKAMVLLGQQQYDEAVAAVERALAINSHLGAAWDTKGQILYAQDQFIDALLCFDRALLLGHDVAVRWHNKANALRMLGRAAEAEAAEQRAKVLGWTE